MSEVPKILIVDGDPRMCESLKALLSEQDYRMDTSHSGKEAIAHLNRGNYDLVLLDVFMPDVDGYQIMDHINVKSEDTLVIVITGHASMESAIGSLRRRAYDYIRKPFEPDELLTTIKNGLNYRRLKKENRVLNGKLAVSEERYGYLVQNSPDIIYTLDQEGNFTFLNHAVERLLGYRIEELMGKHYSTIIHDEDLERARWFFNERRTGDRAASGIQLRLKVCCDCDQFRHYEIRNITIELKSNGMYDKPALETGKKFIGTHGVARDIGDRKRLEQQLHQAQKMEAIATLAGGIAHEFNNALVGITGNIELLGMHLSGDESIKSFISPMKDSTRRMAFLTNQLLAYARGGKYQARPMSLNEFLKGTIPFIKQDVDPTIQIDLALGEGVPHVNADPTQMQMMVSALLNNASEAIEGKGCIRITTQDEHMDEETAHKYPGLKAGHYAGLSVEDDGIGMDDNTRSRIFEPFFTTKFQGRGLGMAAVYGIVRNHEGWISVDSELARGTTVRIYLPAIEIQRPVREEKEPEVTRGTGTILIVEDEEIVMQVSKALIEKLGYRTLAARTGSEAVDMVRTFDGDIDLVLLDIKLPDMGGLKVFQLIKEARPNLTVMVCSGYAIDGPAQEILDAGAQDFVQKPFSLASLSEKIKCVLEYPK